MLSQMIKTSELDFDADSDSEVEDKRVAMTFASSRRNTAHPARTDIFSTNGEGIPLRRRAGYNYPPTWLRSNSQIYKTPPQVNIDSLSMHILDYGYGAHALLTVRQVDAEKQKKLSLEQQSRAGILGRIISGVWVKLSEVNIILFFCLIAYGLFLVCIVTHDMPCFVILLWWCWVTISFI